MNTDISDAGRALKYLSDQLQCAEDDVRNQLTTVIANQEHLSELIDKRDAIQKTLNLTAQFVARETKC